MTTTQHALLSASSAARWLVCTAAPRFEEGLPESTSNYAEEGRLAHSLAEIKVLKRFSATLSERSFKLQFTKIKRDALYNPEMDKTTDLYLEHLMEQAMGVYASAPAVAAEVKVNFADYVPEGFGTCDCVMIGGDTLCITDYKHGKGVPVSAEGNPQMQLYALGALERYSPIYGDTIKKIRMSIDQPRLDSYTTHTVTVEELRAWGESIKPIARKAFSGLGEFVPGDHCRFCRGKALCRARADSNSALEDFKDCIPASTGAQGDEARHILSDTEIGDLLIRGQHLVQWYNDLKEYALTACLNGKAIPGWKAVEGRSIRTWTNQDTALETLMHSGVEKEIIYDYVPKSLAQLEKTIGKQRFAELTDGLIQKSPGKPVLVIESDKRPAYSGAAVDFSEAVGQ